MVLVICCNRSEFEQYISVQKDSGQKCYVYIEDWDGNCEPVEQIALVGTWYKEMDKFSSVVKKIMEVAPVGK